MKKAISILLSIVMLLSGTVFAAPVIETVESANEISVAPVVEAMEDAALMASVQPGLNMWTGDTNAYTFEGTTDADITAYGGAKIATDGTNTYVHMAGNFPHFTLKQTMPVVEADRPVRVTFKTLVNAAAAKAFRAIRNKANATDPYLFEKALASHSTIWQPIDQVIIGSSKAATGGTDDTQDIKNLYIMVANSCTGENVYIDDVKVVPFYKVNYNANGGTGTVEADYFENGTYSDLDDGSALSNGDAEFGGWSLTPNGTYVTSVTATPGEDITLYAVWLSDDVTVKFAGDISPIEDVTVKNGTLLDLTPYLDVTLSDKAVAEHKRFNGWTATGNEADLTTTSVIINDTDGDGVVTLTAIVNHDFNFALQSIRDMWTGHRANVSVGTDGKTIHVAPTTSYPAAVIVDERDGVDFEINTNQYKGAVVYYGYNTSAGTLSSIYYVYGLGVSNEAKEQSWAADGDFCVPKQAPGYGSKDSQLGQFFEKGFDKIYDEDGNVIYGGVETSVDTCYTKNGDGMIMTEKWTGTIKALAVPFIWSNSTAFDLRYVKFIPYNYIDKNIDLAAPVAGEAPQTTVSGTGYTGTVTWSPAVDGVFAPKTNYTATVTLTPEKGYTAYGVAANGYVVEGATKVTNSAEALTLKASYMTAYPGINTWTGTEEPFTFDNSVIGDFYTGGTTTLEADGTNKYIKLGSQLAHFTLKGEFPEIPADRKVKVSFNFNASATRTVALVRNVMNNTSPSWGQKYASVASANTWNNTYTQDIFGTEAGAVTDKSSYITDDTQDIKNVVIMGISSDLSSNPLYIDNVSVVPYYRVTYDANGGTGAPEAEWWLGTTYTVSATIPTLDGYNFVGWSLDGETTVTTVTPENEDFTLTALWEVKPVEYAKPGINTWTGTEAAFTFDNSVIDDFNISGTTTLEEINGDKYMKLASGLAHFTLKNPTAEIEADRLVQVRFQYSAPSQRTVTLVKNKMYSTSPSWGQYFAPVTGVNSWNNYYTQDIMGSTLNEENIKNVVIMGVNGDLADSPLLIDTVSVTPYYKVTYDADGGVTVPEAQWWLPAADENYTVSTAKSIRAGYKFLGWSVDGVTAVTEVVPANEDIALVALWEEDPDQQALEYDFTSTTPGVADGTISVIAPNAGYTTATFYFADENGVMGGYTAFGSTSLTYGLGTYTVTGNRVFAAGATKLSVVFEGEGLENAVKEYTIPEANRLTEEAPLYKYYVVSDLHLGGSSENIDYFYMQGTNATRIHALGNGIKNGDVFDADVDFVVVNGDLVNYGAYTNGEGVQVGEANYWNVLDSYIENRLNIHNVPVFLTNGNHEFQKENGSESNSGFFADRLLSAITGQVDYIEENFTDVKITRDAENPDALYYAADVMGAKYIFMSTPEMTSDKLSSTKTVSDKQLKFIETQIYDGEQSNKTIFVITHLPISSLTNKDAVNEILAKHPNTVVFNSHTHNNLAFDTHYTVVGDMTSSYTTSDTGALSYLAKEPGKDSYTISYNAGQYVEVYEDKVIIKARRFAEESQFFGHALYMVETPDSDKVLPTASISGSVQTGATLTALVNGTVPADDAGYTYEWILDGEVVSTEKTYTVTESSAVCGKYVALRITDTNGDYFACISDMPVVSIETLQVASIKTEGAQGIRYAGFVSSVLRDRLAVEEYGFIVAAKSMYETVYSDADYSELKFNAAGEISGKLEGTNVRYASAAAYTKGGTDYSELLTFEGAKEVFPEAVLANVEGDGYYYSAVLINIPANRYKEALVGKTYVKIGGKYYYGEAIERTVYEMAEALAEKYGENVPDYVKDVLNAGAEN